MKKIILAVSGRKQSGKSSTFNFIEERREGSDDVVVEEFSFAGPLKRMCIDLLGLEPEQVYGNEADKNTLVRHLLWENFPVVDVRSRWWWEGDVVKYHSGPMTGREVMQYWGTEVFRRAYHDVWARAAVKEIHDWVEDHYYDDESGTVVAVMPDCRFPNEVKAVKDAGGYVLRLTRNPFPGDDHPSEVALDPSGYDWSNFDMVLDNRDMTVAEQCEALTPWLREIGAIG